VLRWLIVTPYIHKVHHSDWRQETDSNYSTVLSAWDRLGRTWRQRPDPKTIVFGLVELTDAKWQSWWGMMKTPFVKPRNHSAGPGSEETALSHQHSSAATQQHGFSCTHRQAITESPAPRKGAER